MSVDFFDLEQKRAIISDCGRYRYALYRDLKTDVRYRGKPSAGLSDDVPPVAVWEPRICTFIMLNPSTADGTIDDPTIRRCLGFAHRLKCDQLMVGNLFAWRATDPKDLRKNGVGGGDIVGPENMEWIKALVDVTLRREDNRGYVICAWGPNGRYMRQGEAVLGWIDTELARGGDRTWCLGRSQDGSPRHPLMLKAAAELEVFP